MLDKTTRDMEGIGLIHRSRSLGWTTVCDKIFVQHYTGQDARILIFRSTLQPGQDARVLAVESPRLQKISYRLPDCTNDKMIQMQVCSIDSI